MISKLIRDRLYSQLSAPMTGLNDRMKLLASKYDGVEPYQIDWDLNGSQNFTFGQVQPQLFEQSSPFTYPLLTIDTQQASPGTQAVFGSTFSGTVVAIIDVHHSWPDASVLHDFASPVDLTEHALLFSLLDPEQQNWGQGEYNLLLRKTSVVSRRSAVSYQLAADLWLQSLRVQAQFDLTV